MLRVIPLGLALLYRYYPPTWRILWLMFCYCYCSCFLYFYLYIAMEKCNFLSIAISFVSNASLLTLLTYLQNGRKRPQTQKGRFLGRSFCKNFWWNFFFWNFINRLYLLSKLFSEMYFLFYAFWWRHEIWKWRILKFDFPENERAFEVK